MYFVYVLPSVKLNKRYVGSTSDLAARIHQHNSGKTRFTKGGLPWNIIYKEEYSTLSEARKRELFLKSGVGRQYLDKVLNQDMDRWF
ncbi:MAG: GIY-YIG nuclease family protein [Ignavibacteriales bacterium]|nr:MAG: GIY-YIG nuclease family protein [Ignavibacteriales bacterium]